MSDTLPSRWYQSLSDKTDIDNFVDHLNKLRRFKIIERDYPGKIEIYGEAYYLIRMYYKSEEKKLKNKVIGFLFGNHDVWTAVANELGSRFWDYVKDMDDSTTNNIKLIHSFYLMLSNDTGSSATINYCDALSIDNPYWEPRSIY